MELFIEFDGRQLEIRTDVPAARDLFERTYRPMLVPRLTSSAGRIEFLSRGQGYTIRGLEEVDLTPQLVEQLTDYVKREVLLQFIESRPDLLWLHAAAVERDGSALLISGPSGQGKSTIATRLCDAGWRLLSDDAAPVRMDADVVLPFPQSAYRRKYPGRELAENEMGFFEKEEVLMEESALQLMPTPIRAIIFPLFRYGAPSELTLRLPGEGALDFLRNCTNFADHQEIAVERVARLAQTVPMYHLTYGDGQDAARQLDARSF
jgi:hypothetical protein